jgi:hypothetical protein
VSADTDVPDTVTGETPNIFDCNSLRIRRESERFIMTTLWTGPVGKLMGFDDIRADGGPGRSTVYIMIERGELEAVKMGKLTKVTGRSWLQYKESLLRGLGERPFAA